MNQPARTPKQLGAELRRRRKHLAITQTGLSHLIKKRQATISNLETDGNGTIDTLFSVLSALNLEIAILPRLRAKRVRIEDVF